jgi:hypothetical protein
MVTITLSEDSAEILEIILQAHATRLQERFADNPSSLASTLGDVEEIQRALELALAE